MHYSQYEVVAKKIIEEVGKKVVIGVPLGLGKPIGILNALYRIAEEDTSIQLTIMTGLTLSRPTYKNELEKRLVQPILDRLLGDYEDPLYEAVRVKQQLPKNINVIEFFLSPGKYLHNTYVQQNYISTCYVNVVRDAIELGVNVYAQQVSQSKDYPGYYSLSSNCDLFPEVSRRFKELAQQGKKVSMLAEVNANLPFMLGDDALVRDDSFTDVVDTGRYRNLFAMPHDEIKIQDHLIGLYTSSLIADNGCLQVGIGTLSNAFAAALVFRQQDNLLYREVLAQLALEEKFGEIVADCGSLDKFEKGLYASTEMLSDEYLQLYNANILTKHVYDHIGLQRLLNQGKISENISPAILDVLLEHEIVHPILSQHNIEFLVKYGILKNLPKEIPTDLSQEKNKQFLIDNYLGDKLLTGKIVHAGFFLGTKQLYQQLYDMPDSVRHKIDMTSILRTNSIEWSPELSQLQRINGRFVNSCMMVTLGGAVISDGLKNMQEVSGVGGQFDFVDMAQKLVGARSIVYCRSTRYAGSKLESNIVWDYTNVTLPRYMRDIVVTEYGIADCRSKTDSEIIKAMLNITDSTFQPELLDAAKKAGKLAKDYEIPSRFRRNYLHEVAPTIHALQLKGYCQPYPFGCDLTDEEQVLANVLGKLKNYSYFSLGILILKAICNFSSDPKVATYLARMQLLKTNNIKDWLYKKLLSLQIAKNISANNGKRQSK